MLLSSFPLLQVSTQCSRDWDLERPMLGGKSGGGDLSSSLLLFSVFTSPWL